MPDTSPSQITLPFAGREERAFSDTRPHGRLSRLARGLSHWREKQLVRRALALAGEPTLVLDLPCGAGRFWPVLAEHANRVVIAADDAPGLIEAARQRLPQAQRERIRPLRTSAFDSGLPDGAVDCVFCMQTPGEDSQRPAILRELHRVTRDTLIVSLRDDAGGQVRQGFAAAGFGILGQLDFMPFNPNRRIFVLRKFEL